MGIESSVGNDSVRVERNLIAPGEPPGWVRRTGHAMRRILPASSVRAWEWSVSCDNRLAVTACLNRRLLAEELWAVDADLTDDPQRHAVLGEMRKIPCLRHMLRVDDQAGLSLYIERDWEPELIGQLARLFRAGSALVPRIEALTGACDLSVGCAGIHWRPRLPPRLRFYLIWQAGTGSDWRRIWTSLASHFEKQGCSREFEGLSLLLNETRDAFLINMEAHHDTVCYKLEIPDVASATVERLIAGMGKRLHAPANAMALAGQPLRYLGIRLNPGQRSEMTCYFGLPDFQGA